jgi:hypothetical protein
LIIFAVLKTLFLVGLQIAIISCVREKVIGRFFLLTDFTFAGPTTVMPWGSLISDVLALGPKFASPLGNIG